jgi:chromosome segregation and condensation protein ScpB
MSASDKPLTAGKIAELAGIDKKEVEKAMNVLKKDGKIVSPVRCAWEVAK